MKSELKTIRLSREEDTRITRYLKQNPVFESFSALARAATLAFIEQQKQVSLNPIPKLQTSQRPYFMWDYDISEDEIKTILKSGTEDQQAEMVSRLLSHGSWNDIWKYTTKDQIKRLFPILSFWPKSTRAIWEYALRRWDNES